ncbi:MAG: hypothetical protein CM15mP128_2050 [Methanobacteriota archaeon]|nr:MAG: hypothetical protein CM15mP128_2050 [Euryarchaeota archaeon]
MPTKGATPTSPSNLTTWKDASVHESLLWAGTQGVVVAHPDPNPNARWGAGAAGRASRSGSCCSPRLKADPPSSIGAIIDARVTVKGARGRAALWTTVGTAARFTSEGCLDEGHRLRQRCERFWSERPCPDNP